MKNIFYLVICVMALLFAGCEPNAPATSSKVETGAASDITMESVVLHGVVNVDISQYEDVEFGMMVSEDKAELNARDGEMCKAKVLIGKDFELTLEGLSPETKYYYCAWVFLNNTQYEFGVIKEFTTLEASKIDGIGTFSVSDSKQVTFSKGNLQYHPANDEWRFAESQLDYIGAANSNCSSTYNGWLDLFGWGTGDAPTKSSILYNDYSTFVNWGSNKIGGDAPNTWRTLTTGEWDYVVFNRLNASSFCGVAQVNGVNGLILLPDNWTCPSGVSFKSGFHSRYNGFDYYAAYQTFTVAEWLKLEAAGAVFLPAAGYRNGTNVNSVQYDGYYWSATGNFSDPAGCLIFRSGEADMRGYGRVDGLSVRLVKNL